MRTPCGEADWLIDGTRSWCFVERLRTKSITGQYLSGKRETAVPLSAGRFWSLYRSDWCSENNLAEYSANLLGTIAVTEFLASGKTLVELYPSKLLPKI